MIELKLYFPVNKPKLSNGLTKLYIAHGMKEVKVYVSFFASNKL